MDGVCSSTLLFCTEEAHWVESSWQSGVRLSFTARLVAGFLDRGTFEVIWPTAPFSAHLIWAWEFFVKGMHSADRVSRSSLHCNKLPLLGHLRVTWEPEDAGRSAIFKEAEFLTLMCVLVEGPENWIGFRPLLLFWPISSSSARAINRLQTKEWIYTWASG